MVEPVHPCKRRELDGLEIPPRAAPTDHFGLVARSPSRRGHCQTNRPPSRPTAQARPPRAAPCTGSRDTASRGRCDARARRSSVAHRGLARAHRGPDRCATNSTPASRRCGEQDIDDEGDVDDATPRRHVGQIRHPELVGARRHKRALHQVRGSWRRRIRDRRRLERAATHGAVQPQLPHQSLDRAASCDDAFAAQLPDFAGTVHGEVLIPDPLDLGLQPGVTLGSPASSIGMRLTGLVSKLRGRGNRYDLADRLDPIRPALRVDEGHHHLGRRSSSACAKYADAFRRMSLARRSSRISRSWAFRRSCSSVVSPGRRPVFRLAHPVSQRLGGTADLSATDRIAAHCESCCGSWSKTNRTARSRTSRAYFLGLPMDSILPRNGASRKPGRFNSTLLAKLTTPA